MPALLAAIVFALSACGGGGGGSATLPPAKGSVPGAGTASIRISIPVASGASAQAKRPAFVGSDVNGVIVAVGPHGAPATYTTAFDVSARSSLCATTASVRTCTLSATAPYGADDFAVQTYDTAPVGGTIPTSAHLLGQATTPNVTVTNGTTASVAVYVSGQIANVGLKAGTSYLSFPADGSSHTTTLIVVPTDFANQPIVAGQNDPYANPITVTLTETGGSGNMHLVLNGMAVGSTATLTRSSDSVAIAYGGGGASGYYATVSLRASGATPQSIAVAPMYVTSTSPYYGANGFVFTGAGESAPISISEAAGSGTYTLGVPTNAPCSLAASVPRVTGSGASASATLLSGSTGASHCPLLVTDSNGTYLTLYYETTITSGGITIGGVTEIPVTTSNARLSSITAGTDGKIYAAEAIGGNIDQVDPSTLAITAYTPSLNGSPPSSLIPGADGNIWFVDQAYRVVRLANGVFTNFPQSPTPSMILNCITAGHDGNFYVVDRGEAQVFQVTLNGMYTRTYSIPGSPQLYGCAAGSDGQIYMIDQNNNQIVSLDPASGVTATLAIPTTNSGASYIVTDATGVNFYFNEPNIHAIGTYQIGSSVSEHTLNSTDTPAGLTVGPDGNVWYAEPANDVIAEFDVTTNTVTKRYAIPTVSSSPMGVTTGPDGRIWFTEFSGNNIGVLTP